MLTLHPMKEIRIVVEGEHLKIVTSPLDREDATTMHHQQRKAIMIPRGICCSMIRAAR